MGLPYAGRHRGRPVVYCSQRMKNRRPLSSLCRGSWTDYNLSPSCLEGERSHYPARVRASLHNIKGQGHLEQIAVDGKLHHALLQLRETLRDVQPKAAALGIA